MAELFDLLSDVLYRKASLDQQPIIMMRQTEQSLRNMAMAAPDLIECMPMLDFFDVKDVLPNCLDSISHRGNNLFGRDVVNVAEL